MADTVKTRRYRSAVRAERAAATRRAVVEAAHDLFTRDGYAATTVAEVAQRAGVSVDTVYASVGRKPQLALAVIDAVLGGPGSSGTAEDRDYVRTVRAATDAVRKLEVYAGALERLLPRVAPLQEALREAAAADPDCAATWQALVERRAANMLLLAQDLRATGQLRRDLSDQEVADIIWATNAAEYFQLLQQRGWSPERFGRHLSDLWVRLLLEEPGTPR